MAGRWVTTAGRRSADKVEFLAEHFRCHQHHAFGGDVKTRFVILVILADYHAVRDLAALVDHGTTDAAIASDTDIGKNNNILENGIGLDSDIGEEQRAISSLSIS